MGFRVLAFSVVLLLTAVVGYKMGAADEAEQGEQKESVKEMRSGPHVVLAIQELALLQGTIYYMERVIDLREKQSRFFGLLEAEDAILLVAAGEVAAGVDLSGMGPADVRVDETTQRVTIVLPRAQVFSTRLDNERTYVHARTTDILATRETHLESEARKEAEQGLRQAALEAGIVDAAEKSVARTVAALVNSLGFRDVHISFRPLPE